MAKQKWILYVHHKDGYVVREEYDEPSMWRYDGKLALRDPEVTRVEFKEPGED